MHRAFVVLAIGVASLVATPLAPAASSLPAREIANVAALPACTESTAPKVWLGVMDAVTAALR